MMINKKKTTSRASYFYLEHLDPGSARVLFPFACEAALVLLTIAFYAAAEKTVPYALIYLFALAFAVEMSIMGAKAPLYYGYDGR